VLYAVGDGIITRDSAKKLVDEIISDTNEKKEKDKEKPVKEKKAKNNSAVAEFLKKVK
jgi:polyhydroxyalkanoate synthesis regulator phasin